MEVVVTVCVPLSTTITSTRSYFVPSTGGVRDLLIFLLIGSASCTAAILCFSVLPFTALFSCKYANKFVNLSFYSAGYRIVGLSNCAIFCSDVDYTLS